MIDKLKNIISRVKSLREPPRAGDAIRMLRKFLKQRGCLYTKQRNDERQLDLYFFDYQGGHFVAIVRDDVAGVELSLPGIMSAPMSRLELVRQACNRGNVVLNKFKILYIPDGEKDDINVHLQAFLLAVGDDGQLDELLTDFFVVQRDFVELYKQLEKEADEQQSSDPESASAANERLMALTREQEMRHLEQADAAAPAGSQPMAYRLASLHDSALSVGRLVGTIEAHGAVIYRRLTICTSAAKAVIVDNATEIHNYVLTAPLNDDASLQWIHLVVEYTVGDEDAPMMIEITLSPVAAQGTARYAMMNVVITPARNFVAREPMRHYGGGEGVRTGDILCSLVAIDADPSKMKAEFDYIIGEIERKEASGEDLTTEEEQLYVFSRNETLAASLLYWGRKSLLEQRWLDALLMLETACDLTRKGYYNGDNTYCRHYASACYFVAMAANKLGLYDTALKYLSPFARDGRIAHAREWLVALAGARDLRLFDELERFRNDINEAYDNNDDMPEELIDFVNFMRRCRAWALVEFGDYDEARKMLRSLQRDDANRDFVRAELKYLASILPDE